MPKVKNVKTTDEFAPALGLHYRYIDDKLVFYDGVNYTLAEAQALSKRKEKDEDLRKIHLVKRLFQGELI
jgi:hypothetical protein